jgi:hypothetical protein
VGLGPPWPRPALRLVGDGGAKARQSE